MRRLFLIVLVGFLVACGAPAAGSPPPTAKPASAPNTPVASPTPPAQPSPTLTLLPTALAAPTTPAAAPTTVRDQVAVVEVIDGDTIKVRFGHGVVDTVRYIGIDTPETKDPRTIVECFGREAAAKNAELVGGRAVELERDISERDRYRRLLRYVWVKGDDGATRMVNQELVAGGFAAASSYPPDVKHQDLFQQAERLARAEKRGLWGTCSGPHAPLPTATPAPAIAAPTVAPRPAAPAPVVKPAGQCDPAYPTLCLKSPPPDLNCKDIPAKRFPVLPPDPHRLDADKDGIGCES